MIITFATQKGGTGKTTLAIAFANYISGISDRKVNVFDFDFQKSFYYKWKEDEISDIPKLYDVEIIEKHHHFKVDAPSGTALMLAVANQSLGIAQLLVAAGADPAQRSHYGTQPSAQSLWQTQTPGNKSDQAAWKRVLRLG